MPKSVAARFFERFGGLERAYGQYKEATPKGKQAPGTKKKGSARTIHKPPTEDNWQEHLDGEIGIGVIPIRDDATTNFGAIDVDEYKGDLNNLAREIATLELPLILCRSKSGGAHLYLFTSEHVPAELVRGKLMEWAVSLGYSGVEVFPKQVRLANERDIGNWINMPYYNASKTNRYAVAEDKKLTVKQFLDLADMIAVDEETLKETTATGSEEFQETFYEAPPCLQTLAKRGFGEGSRNNGLFNVAVYLRKRFGDDDWNDHIDEYNQGCMSPPLGHSEVATIVRGVKRKAYEFRCNDQPIVQVCNKQICLAREFGVGTGENDPGVVFGSIVKLNSDPPVWIWDVDGARIELATQELKDQGRFHTRCMEEINKWPLLIKPKAWAELVREKLQGVEIVEVPDDAKPEGLMWFHLEQYWTSKVQARSKEELLMFKPYHENGRTYFNGPHFKIYLEQNRLRITQQQLWAWLRERGAKQKFWNIKGKGINTWSVESFKTQDEDFTVPSIEDEEL
jgi:hypothetical protein